MCDFVQRDKVWCQIRGCARARDIYFPNNIIKTIFRVTILPVSSVETKYL